MQLSLQMIDVFQNKQAVKYLAEAKEIKIAQLLLKRFSDLFEMIKILQIPYKCTIALQARDLTLPDAFGLWLQMIVLLTQPDITKLRKTNLATCLFNALNERKTTIFDNSLMQCGLYLDPRFRGEILRDRDIAQQTVQKLTLFWNRIKTIREADTIEATTNRSADSSDLQLSLEFNNTDALEMFLTRNDNAFDMETFTMDCDIETELVMFQPEKVSVKTNLMEYWESLKSKHPRLYEMAQVLYAIPPTEVETERDFSHLEHVYSAR